MFQTPVLLLEHNNRRSFVDAPNTSTGYDHTLSREVRRYNIHYAQYCRHTHSMKWSNHPLSITFGWASSTKTWLVRVRICLFEIKQTKLYNQKTLPGEQMWASFSCLISAKSGILGDRTSSISGPAVQSVSLIKFLLSFLHLAIFSVFRQNRYITQHGTLSVVSSVSWFLIHVYFFCVFHSKVITTFPPWCNIYISCCKADKFVTVFYASF